MYDLSESEPDTVLNFFCEVPRLRIVAAGGDGTACWILSALDRFKERGK